MKASNSVYGKLRKFKTRAIALCVSIFIIACNGDQNTQKENIPLSPASEESVQRESMAFGNESTLETSATEISSGMNNGHIEGIDKKIEPINQDNTQTTSIQDNRLIIKRGMIKFESKDVNKTHQLITSIAQSLNGYLASDQVVNDYYNYQYITQIRVPTEKFEALLEQISVGVERFDDKSISAVDVTEQFVDAKARLKTKKQVEERYIHLLSKAGMIVDILTIERKIGEIRGEIEAAEGKLNVLKNQASFSTLTITYYQPKPEEVIEVVDVAFGFFEKISTAANNGWEILLWLIIGLTNVWPMLIVIGYILYRILKRKEKVK